LTIEELALKLCVEFNRLNLGLVTNAAIIALAVESTLPQDIAKKGQLEGEKIEEIRLNIMGGKSLGFTEG
jgi:hypothetical protein